MHLKAETTEPRRGLGPSGARVPGGCLNTAKHECWKTTVESTIRAVWALD